MHTPALALLLALAGPADTVRIAPDSINVVSDSVVASIPSRLMLPVSLQIESDTTPRRRRKSIEVSEWYERRLRIHRYGAYAMIPLFAFQAAAGNELYNKGSGADGWARNGHRAGATALATVFGVNTVTGLWNLWDSRKDPAGRTKRYLHALMFMAASAGFTYAGVKLADEAEQSADKRSLHRTVALSSMGLSLVSWGIMLF